MVALGGRGSVRLQAAGIARQRGEIRLRAMHKYSEAERTNPLEKLSSELSVSASYLGNRQWGASCCR